MTGDYMTRGPAVRGSSAPTCSSTRRAPLDADMIVAGPVKVQAARLDDRHRLRLRRQARRRLSERLPDAGAAAGAAVRANAVKMGGYQQLVRGEPFRGKFRNSFEKPEPFVAGEPATITFELPDVYHAFRKGHRMMVQVQSSWFPLVDRNPQVFMEIPTAKPSDFKKATQRVYRVGRRCVSHYRDGAGALGMGPAAVLPSA